MMEYFQQLALYLIKNFVYPTNDTKTERPCSYAVCFSGIFTYTFFSGCKSSSKEYEKLLAKFALVLSTGFYMISFPYALIKWLRPCNTATFAYKLIPECRNPGLSQTDWATSSTLLLIMICIITVWLVTDNAGSFAIFIAEFSFTQAYCLRRYVQQITLKIVENPSEANRVLPILRQLQILSRCYNLIQQDKLIISSLLMTMVSVIFSFYTMIALGSQMLGPEWMLFPITALVLLWY